jgi:hypothetical protein
LEEKLKDSGSAVRPFLAPRSGGEEDNSRKEGSTNRRIPPRERSVFINPEKDTLILAAGYALFL